jgi:glyoxylase-like metal-dependent hydrolase (beta-lactamase superfamily II)
MTPGDVVWQRRAILIRSPPYHAEVVATSGNRQPVGDVNRISRLGLVNAYLVREDDGLTLIDAMIGGSARKIIASAEVSGAPIVRILLTHAHADHIGSLDALKEKLPAAEVIISTRDARLLDKDMSLDPDEPKDKLRGGYPGAETKPDRTVEPGDRVGLLEVIASPGHTPGHVALLDPRDGTLYCGDVYSTVGGVATSAKLNPLFPLALFTWHRPTELESARKLRSLEPVRLAPGHGKVVESPLEAMDRALARAS